MMVPPMSDIKSFLDYLFDDGETFEVCLLGASGKHRLWDNEFCGKQIIAGWFKDKVAAAEIIAQADKEAKPTAIYCTLNPCNEALLGRAANRLKVVKSRTSDKEIAAVKHLLVDVDPQRPAGISATEEELGAALLLTRRVYADLKARGWADPLCACSGNGYHLIYRVADAYPELIKAFLLGLSAEYTTPQIAVDTTVFNPARLVKIAGTTARKGDNIPARPHRLSKILNCPTPQMVEAEYLLPFAEKAPQERRQTERRHDERRETPFDVRAYLDKYGIGTVGTKRHGSATMYLLENCLFDPSHTGKEAAIMQDDSGKLQYYCFHNSCQGQTWHDARQLISGNDSISATPATPAMPAAQAHASTMPAECQQDASKQSRKPAGNLYQEIKNYILENSGTITTNDVDSEFCLRTREEKNTRAQVLRNLQKQGLVEKHGVKTGYWRIKDDDLEVMDLFAANPEPIPLPLPLGISDHVKIYPKSIIVVAGSSNAGKSAFGAGIAFATHAPAHMRDINNKNYNKASIGQDDSSPLSGGSLSPGQEMAKIICPEMDEIETWYFNSEASAEELRERWSKYPGGLESFRKVKPVFRSKDFQDVIRPNAINIIDYLEVYDNFWEIGTWIREIFDKLDKGIAIILIQKKTGATVGRGGDITMEKARLYLALENNAPHGQICKVVKAKSFVDYNFNPNGHEIDFKLSGGHAFQPISGWRVVDEKERANINLRYKLENTTGKYAFEFKLEDGSYAGLTPVSYQQWKDSYVNLDLAFELEKIRVQCEKKPWLDKKSWFFQVAGILNKLTSKTMATG
jgi:hypothetical protein